MREVIGIAYGTALSVRNLNQIAHITASSATAAHLKWIIIALGSVTVSVSVITSSSLT
jgi:hypothetical protein